ncbi:MAG: glycosyltransferase family 4 protein [Chloroflexi bacterium]|nr:glycosyltransferase family 4 protein [Chloroflexota bacterium]
MNILYLCADRGIPIRGHKGAAVHVRALTDAFVRAGQRVTILTPRVGPSDGCAPLAELIHIPLPEMNLPDDARVRQAQAQAYADVLYPAARDLLARQSFDFIYERYSLWSNVGARLARATRLPLVLEVNAPLRQEFAAYRQIHDTARAAQIEAEQFTQANAISVVSEPLREYVVQRGALEERVYVLPNAVDPTHFHPAVRGESVRQRYAWHDRIVIGFVGKPRPWHDLETLCAAFVELHASDARYHLLLVGDMPMPPAIEQYGLQDAVTLTGPVAHEVVPAHIAACDVVVAPHPALADFYFSPLKLFEYLACGVPTVAANIGQPAAVVREGETGFLYPPGDAHALAERIRQIIAAPDRARAVAWNGAAYVLAQHTWDKNARAVVDWLAPQPYRRSTGTSLRPTSNVQPPDVPPERLYVQRPTSRRSTGTSLRPTSNLPTGTSLRPTSNLQTFHRNVSTSNLQRPTSNVQPPTPHLRCQTAPAPVLRDARRPRDRTARTAFV